MAVVMAVDRETVFPMRASGDRTTRPVPAVTTTGGVLVRGLVHRLAARGEPMPVQHALAIVVSAASKVHAAHIAVCTDNLQAWTIEARRLATTQQMSFTNIFRGLRGLSQPPIDDIETYWTPIEKAQVTRMLARSIVGSAETVRIGVDGSGRRISASWCSWMGVSIRGWRTAVHTGAY